MVGRRSARTAIAVATATLVLFTGQSVATSQAAPTPSPSPTPSRSSATEAKLKDAKARIHELEEQEDVLGEQFAAAAHALAKSRERQAVLQTDIAAQQAKVDALGEQVRAIALLQFRNRSVDPTVQVFTSGDPDTMLDRLSTADKVVEDMKGTLALHEAEQANLRDMQRTQVAETAALAAEEQRLGELKKDLQDKVDQAQALVLQLTSQQRAELEAADGGEAEWDQDELDGVSANAKALGAIKYAVSKVKGGQYVWGAAGPRNFDCSGLMLAAYRSVGISLPHSSQAQSRMGHAVSRSELRPGDLIFWYHPIHHVGMYIGNGKIVHARNTRSDLVVQTLSSYPAPWAGARRVVG